MNSIEIHPVTGMGLVRPGDDLVAQIVERLAATGRTLVDGDVLVLTSKVVSKSEGRVVELGSVKPQTAALALARVSGRDARLCELIIRNTRKVWGLIPSGVKLVEWSQRLPQVFPVGAEVTARMFASEPTMILAELPTGLCLADAGIDSSNVEGTERVILLPANPNESCRRFATQFHERTGARVAVIISDTEFRANRFGSMDHAIGSWGIQTVAGHFGSLDFVGRPKHGGMEATTDSIVAAASLVMGNCAEGIPAVVVRGARYTRMDGGMLPVQEPPSTYLKSILFNFRCRVRLAWYRTIGAGRYEDFWPYFMQVHSDPLTQRLHVVATLWGLACLLVAFPLTRNGAWLLLAPAVSYPIAWFSHFVVERNRPAAWTNPYWAFLCDLDMSAMYLTGQLQPELDRLRQEPSARFTPRRRFVHHATEVLVLVYIVAVIVLTMQGRLSFAVPSILP